MKCFSVLLGAGKTPAAGRKFRARDDALIRDVTTRFFPSGYTILKSSGGWFDPTVRKFGEEESRQTLVSATQRARLRPWSRVLAAALQQKEILVLEPGPFATFRFRRLAQTRKRPAGAR